jgi:hypothetical protein
MSQSAVEEAVKILIVFEENLKEVKEEASETRRRLSAVATEQGETVKKEVLATIQTMTDGRVADAKESAQQEAKGILSKGDESIKRLMKQITKNKDVAAEAVIQQLLGDQT